MSRFAVRCVASFLLAMGCIPPAGAARFAADQALAGQDYAGAYRLSIEAAQDGDADAMLLAGTLLDLGKGVPQDFAAALGWYRRAAEAGNVHAMFNCAVMFDNGRGTDVDRDAAIHWYERAADLKDARAAYALGVIYRDGDGVPRDRARAIKAFRQAAEGNIEAARINLIALNAAPARPAPHAAHQRPVPATTRPAVGPEASPAVASAEADRVQQALLSRTAVDPATAATLSKVLPSLVERAGKGGGAGLYDMGYAYQHGLGVPRDTVKSYIYYLQASLSAEPAVKSAALRGAGEVGASLTDAEHQSAQSALLQNQ